MELVKQFITPSKVWVAQIGNIPNIGWSCPVRGWKSIMSGHRLVSHILLDEVQQIHSGGASGIVTVPVGLALGVISVVTHPFYHKSMHERKIAQSSIDRCRFHIDANGLAVVLRHELRKRII